MAQYPQTRCAGGIEYLYQPKAVRNLNLRIRTDGQVCVSAPRSVPLYRVDAFVAQRADWVTRTRQKLTQRQPAVPVPLPDRAEALALFTRVSEEIYPLFETVLGGRRPLIKVRSMTSRWGVCRPASCQITLALQLASQPLPLIEYVVLHEYCHFVHPDHQAGFWALMTRLMPDCKERRRALRG